MEKQITEIIRDCFGQYGDTNVEKVKADSLMDLVGFVIPEKANAAFEDVLKHVKKLPKQFLDPDRGWTFLNLPFLANGEGLCGKRWGNGNDCVGLIILCSYYGIIQDNLKALDFKSESLASAPGGASYFAFNTEPRFLDAVRRNLGLS
ncbi:MAG: hypothetical protein IBX56_20090 [Methylomicrobium sp.]|nr:hypothetical protein [Methylomicrobium sp.]